MNRSVAARAALAAALLLSVGVSGCFGDGSSDWAFEMAGLRTLQADGYDGSGVAVAVIDTGVDADHPSLDHITIKGWKDFVNERPDPYDDHGHGSHVTGILAGKGADFNGRLSGFDLNGAATGITLIPIKAIGQDSSGESSDVADAVDHAIAEDADVICLSLGSQPSPLNLVSDQMRDAVNRALDEGILVVASAGNNGPDGTVQSPASIPGVIAVGAVDEDENVADFSAQGDNEGVAGSPINQREDPDKKPETVAPGVGIKSAWRDGGYAVASGTSQAAPFVCGGLALVLDAHPKLKAEDGRSLIDKFKSRLMQSADPVPGQETPHDDRAGYGLFDAAGLGSRF